MTRLCHDGRGEEAVPVDPHPSAFKTEGACGDVEVVQCQ